ncbi:hypothetical protein ACEV6Q_26910, partial [Enterobacter ludwigii]|uniref:hypothetical protein n=1 Tax=Enterobacter ludwigii TaxID=299767 RepID=UPI003BEEFA88
MTSEKRLTLNFKESKPIEDIEYLSSLHGIGKSEYIKRLIEQQMNGQEYVSSLMQQCDYSNAQIKNLLNIFFHRITTTHEGKKSYHVQSQQLELKYFEFTCSLDEIESNKYSSGISRSKLRNKIKELVISHLKTPMGNYFNYCTPDYFLVFERGSSINVQKIKAHEHYDVFMYKVTAIVNVEVIPVIRSEQNAISLIHSTPLFDTKNIQYRRYKDVARDGWDRDKYSHIAEISECLKPPKLTTPLTSNLKPNAGGFFIGVHKNKQNPFDNMDYGKFSSIPLSDGTTGKTLRFKYHSSDD